MSKADEVASARKWFCIAMIALSAFLWIEDTFGYELPDQFRKWNTDTINVYYKSEDCLIPTQGLWHRAAIKWGVLDVVEKGRNGVGFDYFPTLYCANDEPLEIIYLPPNVEVRTDYVTNETGSLILASARQYWVNGAMVDCDIRLHPLWVTNLNVEAVMLHELGHCLGVGHSENALATMFWILVPRESLHADDYLAACELYGRCRSMDTMGNISVRNVEYDGECLDVIIPWGWDWKTERNLTITECREVMR